MLLSVRRTCSMVTLVEFTNLSLGGLTYPVQSVNGNRLKGPPHHGILFQHLVEIVHRERVQATVGVRSHTGRPPPSGQQTDLWWGERRTHTRDGRFDQKMADSQTSG